MKHERGNADLLPFSATQKFVQDAYNNSFLGDILTDPSRLNPEKPHTIIGENVYDARFSTQLLEGKEYPLVASSIRGRSGSKEYKIDRNTHLGLTYLFSGLTLEDIGKLNGISKARVSQIVIEFLDRQWKASPNKIKRRYPRERLTTKKDYVENLYNEGEKQTIPAQIRAAFRSGATTKDLFAQYKPTYVGQVRTRLRQKGLPAPEKMLGKVSKLVPEILNPNTSTERLCKLIKHFNSSGLIRKYLKGENPLLTPVSDVMLIAWGNKNPRNARKAQELLIEKNVPAMDVPHPVIKKGEKQTYYYRFIFTRCKEEAVRALEQAPDNFKGSPISLAYGKLQEGKKSPNTTMTIGSQQKSHERVIPMLKKLGIRRKDRSWVLGTTPIPIFKHQRQGLFVAAENAAQLRQHLALSRPRN